MRRVAIALLVIGWLAGDALAQTPVPVPVDPGPGSAEPQPHPEPVEQAKPPERPAEPPARVETKAEPPAGFEESQEIRDIIVEDNTKTTSETVELISGIEVGETWRPDMADLVKSRLVSSGLFKDVEVYWTKTEGGVAVHILAKDKHSWVLAPAFYTQPTNIGGGIGFGENNLFGQNQKLLLYGQIATGDTFFLGAWIVPSIGGTRFSAQLDTYLKSARVIEYAAPTSYMVDGPMDVIPVRESRIHYYNFGVKLGIELWHGIKFDARLRGAKVSFVSVKLIKDQGATIDDILPGGDPLNPPKPGAEGWDVSNELTLTIDRRANWYGVQTGHRYVLAFEQALPSLGSDFRYYSAMLGVFKAWQVLENHNLVARTSFGYGYDLPFQQEFLTGGTSMRGWLNDEFRGDLKWAGTVEYSFPLFTIKGFSMRGLGFFDSAYTTFLRTDPVKAQRAYLPNSQVRGFDGFKNSVGVGTRFYLRQIVLPLLGLDFGYGVEARDFQVYLAIGLTD